MCNAQIRPLMCRRCCRSGATLPPTAGRRLVRHRCRRRRSGCPLVRDRGGGARQPALRLRWLRRRSRALSVRQSVRPFRPPACARTQGTKGISCTRVHTIPVTPRTAPGTRARALATRTQPRQSGRRTVGKQAGARSGKDGSYIYNVRIDRNRAG